MGIPLDEQLVNVLSDFLGEPKNSFGHNGECEFNCPKCAEMEGVESDGKYNLQVNIYKGVFHCWKCGSYGDDSMNGHIFKLIREYGGKDALKEYKSILNDMKESGLYNLGYRANPSKEETIISLPNKMYSVEKVKKAREYLAERSIGEDIIKKFNLRCTLGDNDKWQYNYRIIIPSYDSCGILNYWTGRDYLGRKGGIPKYYNSEGEKKKIIFNESAINWNADVTIVEGPFDMLSCVPNSIPSLGKVIDSSYDLFWALQNKLNAKVNIFYDGDAFASVKKAYKALNKLNLSGRVRYVPVEDGLDPNDILKKYGRKGVIEHVKAARQFSEDELEYE